MLAKIVALGAVALGIVLVALLAAWGADLRRAARTGPRWKRRLIAVGLGLLASTSCGPNPALGPDSAAPSQSENTLTDTDTTRELIKTRQWRRICSTWKDAHQIARKKDLNLLDRLGRDSLIKRLQQAEQDIRELHQDGLLSAAEAGLLEEDRKYLTSQIPARPRPLFVTCYVVVSPRFRAKERMGRRLPLLAELAKSGTLRPEVLKSVLDNIDRDLETLERGERRIYHLPEIQEARHYLGEIRARMAPASEPTGHGPEEEPLT